MNRVRQILENAQANNAVYFSVIVVAIMLPTGNIEIATNYGDEAVRERVLYYLTEYNESMIRNRTDDSEIVGVMIL